MSPDPVHHMDVGQVRASEFYILLGSSTCHLGKSSGWALNQEFFLVSSTLADPL